MFSYYAGKVHVDAKGVLEMENTLPSDQPVTVAVDHRRSAILVSLFSGYVFSIPFKGDLKGKSKRAASPIPIVIK
jgi:hypothetical protein